MEIHILEAGTFMTRGEEMFCGLENVDWQKHYAPEKNGLCLWAMRCLLIIDEDRKILIDTGPGTKLNQQTIDDYHIAGTHLLEKAMAEKNIAFDDISHVILSHLHFDHCGGSTIVSDNGEIVPAFRNAKIFISKKQWNYALSPVESDKESYRKIDFIPLKKSNRIIFVEHEHEILPNISVKFVDGHTPGQMIPFIKRKKETIVFAADLLPSAAHIEKNYIMSYDLSPQKSNREKRAFLNEAVKNNYKIIFQHDKEVYSSSLSKIIQFGSGFRIIKQCLSS
ncbi:MAG: MBL fold metallo-hydrolase [Bacteroidota bacterium]|nr:MBL fold metallo-hydrolase [Bacteroidota bacterium]